MILAGISGSDSYVYELLVSSLWTFNSSGIFIIFLFILQMKVLRGNVEISEPSPLQTRRQRSGKKHAKDDDDQPNVAQVRSAIYKARKNAREYCQKLRQNVICLQIFRIFVRKRPKYPSKWWISHQNCKDFTSKLQTNPQQNTYFCACFVLGPSVQSNNFKDGWWV